MEAKELMKGNIVGNNSLDIFNKGYVIMEARWIYEKAVYESAQSCEEYAREFYPIRLTVPVLEMLGFEKLPQLYFIKGFNIKLSLTDKGVVVYYRDIVVMNDNIKYAHQLQNLYYALTGEELTTN